MDCVYVPFSGGMGKTKYLLYVPLNRVWYVPPHPGRLQQPLVLNRLHNVNAATQKSLCTAPLVGRYIHSALCLSFSSSSLTFSLLLYQATSCSRLHLQQPCPALYQVRHMLQPIVYKRGGGICIYQIKSFCCMF